jgi:peptidoglycan/xylan/chitin deacetylase (PgdA/CDA1 family)
MAPRFEKTVSLRQGLKRRCARLYRHLSSARRTGDLVILTYHSIQPDEPFSTSPEVLAQQLEYVAGRFNLPALDEWLQARDSDQRDGRPAALITFDDGYENFHRFAYPLLQRFNVPAVVFVATGFVTGGCGVEERLDMYRRLPPLSWAQLREIKEGGITIGSHTHRHLHLGQAAREQVEEELSCSKKLLEDRLGAEVKYFAYPWGQRQHIGRETVSLLPACGYLAACSTLWGKNTVKTNPYLLRRVRIDPWDSLEDFQAKVEGAWDFVGYYHRLQ